MITVIKGNVGSGKTTKIIELANSTGENGKEVLIIRPYPVEGLLEIDNITLTQAADENLVHLIDNADVILIDETGTMLEGIELVYLDNLGKNIYYTAQRLEQDMPYDEIIEVDWDNGENY